MGKSCGTAMAGTSRHNHAQSSVPLNVATVEKSSPFYGNRQPIPGRQTCACKSVAITGAAIYPPLMRQSLIGMYMSY